MAHHGDDVCGGGCVGARQNSHIITSYCTKPTVREYFVPARTQIGNRGYPVNPLSKPICWIFDCMSSKGSSSNSGDYILGGISTVLKSWKQPNFILFEFYFSSCVP